jgi:hypothetical protein
MGESYRRQCIPEAPTVITVSGESEMIGFYGINRYVTTSECYGSQRQLVQC